MVTPDRIRELVNNFKTHYKSYRSSQYNETQVRREFIDPFFQALGWDVSNSQSIAEAYKDVIHEDAIKIGGETKAPDYCFRIGGKRQFFVEAKKPFINIKENPYSAFQLKRYAWSSKMPISILTDFEEFVVYDCRLRPHKDDSVQKGRILYLRYEEYTKRWEEIYNVFSKQSVLDKSLEKFSEKLRSKKGTSEVDNEFLKEIENWREILAKDIAINNNNLKIRELNYSVQKIIDRIIFLRIAEDRGIERYAQLKALNNGEHIYNRLNEIFEKADARYNSGLFHFKEEKDISEGPDTISQGLIISDSTLKKIFSKIYFPESPYEFSVLPADILGHVYEQFLGKVINLNSSHQATVEDKPDVKKAGGVYYTPTYIVEYIVKNTIGKLLINKTPKQVAKLKILDPACGSGSFLLEAYTYLLDWHRDWYINDDPNKYIVGKNPILYQGLSGQYLLTTDEKKRILLSNIFGVDIDSQAVEVTKLSLLLKVLEGENQETLLKQMLLFHERVLPDLGKNIKCGNSLIGTEIYIHQLNLFESETKYRINAFDWDSEFKEIMDAGGFDIVIGNPPYIRIQAMKEWAPIEVEFYKQHYKSARNGNYDIYVVFVEKGLNLLNKSGLLGFILPHKFFNSQYGKPLREIISKGKHISGIVHFGDKQVFKDATTYTTLMFLSKKPVNSFELVRVNDMQEWQSGGTQTSGAIKADALTSSEWNLAIGKSASLFERLEQMPTKLGNVANRIYQGPITSADPVFLFKESRNKNQKTTEVFSKELNRWVKIETQLLKRVVRSGDIGRYWAKPTAYTLFPYSIKNGSATLLPTSELENDYPLAWSYLLKNKPLLRHRENRAFNDTRWYRFGRTQNLGMWEQQKLLVPYMVTRLCTYPDISENLYFINVTTGGYGITVDEHYGSYLYFSALLNSKLLDFFLKQVSTTFHGGYFAANKQYIEQLPIRTIKNSNKKDKETHDKIVNLVKNLLALNTNLLTLSTDHEKDIITRQIEAAENEINSFVYKLYDIAPGEIAIVEEGQNV